MIVDTLQASRVNMPPPHATHIHLSIPPIRPAMIPAGPPKSSPAVSGAASLQFTVAPLITMPHSFPTIAMAPNISPMNSCFCTKDLLPKLVLLSSR